MTHPRFAERIANEQERRVEILQALLCLYQRRPDGVTLNEIDIHIRSAKAGDLAEALAFVEEHENGATT